MTYPTIGRAARSLALTLVLLSPASCMAPNFARLIPENKDANVLIYNPIYGQVLIQTRVWGSTNVLGAIPNTIPMLPVK